MTNSNEENPYQSGVQMRAVDELLRPYQQNAAADIPSSIMTYDHSTSSIAENKDINNEDGE